MNKKIITHYHGSVEILKDDCLCPLCFISTYVGSTIICEKCEYWFHFKCVGLTPEHSCVKNKKEQYFCYKCKFDLQDLSVVVKKMDTTYLKRFYPFKCNVCPKRYEDRDEAMDHYLRDHRMKCPICEKEFHSQKEVEDHIENWHDESKIRKVLDKTNSNK